MTSRKRHWIASCTLLGMTMLGGCAEHDVAVPQPAPAVVPVTPVVEADLPPAGVPSGAVADETDDSVVDDNGAASGDEVVASAAPSPAVTYEPPFPDRVDLFVAPKRQGNASGNQDSSDRAVELMGFIRVDVPRAILSINGETNALAEGENAGGIEVISVQPPSVVLRRGRQRWQATIE